MNKLFIYIINVYKANIFILIITLKGSFENGFLRFYGILRQGAKSSETDESHGKPRSLS